MKTKKMSKRLSLNKKTITDLNDSELNSVRGGIDTGYSCPGHCDTIESCGPTQCPACLTTTLYPVTCSK
jgi:natural product precursor